MSYWCSIGNKWIWLQLGEWITGNGFSEEITWRWKLARYVITLQKKEHNTSHGMNNGREGSAGDQNRGQEIWDLKWFKNVRHIQHKRSTQWMIWAGKAFCQTTKCFQHYIHEHEIYFRLRKHQLIDSNRRMSPLILREILSMEET